MTLLHLTEEHYEVLDWVSRQTMPAPLKDEHEKPLKALVDTGLVDLEVFMFRGILPKLTTQGVAVLTSGRTSGNASPCPSLTPSHGHDKSCVLGACLKSEGDGFDKDALLKQVREAAAKIVEDMVMDKFRRIGDGTSGTNS